MDRKRTGKSQWIIALLFILFASFVSVDFFLKLRTMNPFGYEQTGMAKEVPLGILIPGETVSQEIPYDSELEGISVLLNVYERENPGTLTLTAAGNRSGEVLAQEAYSAAQLMPEGRANLLLTRKPAAEDDAVVLTLTTTGGQILLATAWTTAEDAVPEAGLIRGGEEQKGDLVFERIVRTPERYTYAMVVFCLMIAAGLGGLGLLLRAGAKTENTVFLLVLMIGMLYLIIFTPLSIPDEQTHYQTAYRLSSVLMFQGDQMDRGENVYFDYSGLSGHYNTGTGYDRIVRELTGPKEEGTGFRTLKNRIDYPLMYLPQAIGIAIGRLLGMNFLMLFWLGRLCNLLFYALCVRLALRAATRFSTLLALCSLTPMVMQQAASYSYDTFINGLALLLLALMLRCADQKGRIRTSEYLSLLAVSMLMAPAKAVYTPILGLMIFIPAERFGGAKGKWLRIGYIWVAALAAVALFQLGGIQNVVTSGGGATNWEGAMNYSLSWLLSHPAETVKLFVNTLRINLSEWLYQAVGSRLSGLSMEVTGWKITGYIILLVLASLSAKGDESRISARERVGFLGAAGLVIFLILLTMLLNWTTQGEQLIQGIQGRYFIPVLPLIWMSLNNRALCWKENPKRVLILCAVAVHLAVLSGVLRMTVLS